MSYTEDAVKAKLSSLNDQQESIVSVAQWIMFHRRSADRTAQLWLERIKDASSSRRLALIYLANEICQQSKVRKKEEFTKAWTPLIAEATAISYKGATLDLQGRIRRVVGVWRERGIFDPAVQMDIESRLDQIDQARGSGRKAQLGGTLSSSSQPPVASELQSLLGCHASLTRAETQANSASTALAEDDKLKSPEAAQLTLPVQANRLGAALKQLANAEGAVAEKVRARAALVAELETLVAAQRAQLRSDEALAAELRARKTAAQDRKAHVEHQILLSMAADAEPMRPQDEPLTPPPVESLTPAGSPAAGAPELAGEPPRLPPAELPPLSHVTSAFGGGAAARTADEALHQVPVARSPVNGEGPLSKKRRIGSQSVNDEEAAFASSMMGDLDDDVAAMLDGK